MQTAVKTRGALGRHRKRYCRPERSESLQDRILLLGAYPRLAGPRANGETEVVEVVANLSIQPKLVAALR